ncbi:MULTISPECIES: helix-turn-helix transcriptional regulator [Empedobacter]|uniref:helix-turn-helix transcriptional regulator n=1 Tax=Empedobacter TaxID=59734 RepID=UPI0028D4652E|nr:helix-turn-helix transcriptional regulator [Empedobacter tilapiae]
MNVFKEKLEYQRVKNSISKEELADKVGITRQTLYNYLAGRNPNWEFLQNIQNVFEDISMDYWINDSISMYDDHVKFSNKASFVNENVDDYSQEVKFSIINKKLDTILRIITDQKVDK